MLGDSSLLGSPGGGLAGEHDGGGAVGSNSNSGDEDKAGERSFGGNRWPRQETIALLKIRSDMDVAFREASVKGPLWDDVSRKLGELGYHRSAKKCKEKFENVYKYHKRTKEGRGGKPDGKTYRFFEQLEALETHHNSISMSMQQPKPQTIPPATAAATPVSFANVSHSHPPQAITVPPAANPTVIQPQIPSFQNADLLSNSSASTYSDEEAQGRRKKKRKWKDFFERLMKEVISKQEELQKRFVDAIEKREQERIAREETWRMQEMTRISREREMLAQERSMAAAKDSAVMSFLQNVSSQQQNPAKSNSIPILPPPPPPPTQPPSINTENGGADVGTGTPGSSRWPKVEVEALIQLRTNLDSKYQDNGPKGPLWEEISAGMRRLGYNRSSKRCKEKWENINKYFKKVKESNKKRPQDSKTCPYFHQLDALYRNKQNNNLNYITAQSSFLSSDQSSAPMMVRPEQQWPPTDQNQTDIKLDGTDGDEDDEMEEDEEEEGEDEFELVASKPPTMAAE